jgi:hypothetical protein
MHVSTLTKIRREREREREIGGRCVFDALNSINLREKDRSLAAASEKETMSNGFFTLW